MPMSTVNINRLIYDNYTISLPAYVLDPGDRSGRDFL